ncbi:hypothetical protein BC941DRAFT_419747 [Chlamydoabsidia padenii]|nr:hypothetical protein BC941DRAFT_419747 [Chlamydoabsidia padenii]
MSMLFRLTILVCLLLALVKAQVGPVITEPANNATVSPGKTLSIAYSYPNLGPGTYTVDVNLWQDAAVTQLIQNLLTGVSVPEGSSNGTSNAFNTSTTINVDMPSNLTDTFYLTLHQHVKTQNGNAPAVRSFPLMLHSAAMSHIPQSMSVLLAVAVGVFGLSFLAM